MVSRRVGPTLKIVVHDICARTCRTLGRALLVASLLVPCHSSACTIFARLILERGAVSFTASHLVLGCLSPWWAWNPDYAIRLSVLAPVRFVHALAFCPMYITLVCDE